MLTVDVKIESVGKGVANCTALSLEDNGQFRYLFIPRLIENHKDKSNSIGGKFIVQKKGKNEKWEDYNVLPLYKMEKDTWINLDLSTSKLDNLIAYVTQLKEQYEKEGKAIFNTTKTFVFSDSADGNDIDLLKSLVDDSGRLKDTVKEFAKSQLDNSQLLELLKLDEESIKKLVGMIDEQEADNFYNILKAKFIDSSKLRENLDNDSEQYWQLLFSNNPNILFSIIPSALQIINGQTYTGGKAVNNKGGKVSDFMLRYGLRNTSFIEIKTPCTKILGEEYRSGCYSISKDLVGAVVQIKTQKDSFLKEYNGLKVQSEEFGINFEAYDPKIYLFAGNNSDFDFAQRRSFELFRNELKDVEIITYNELIDKLELIQESLTSEISVACIENKDDYSANSDVTIDNFLDDDFLN